MDKLRHELSAADVTRHGAVDASQRRVASQVNTSLVARHPRRAAAAGGRLVGACLIGACLVALGLASLSFVRVGQCAPGVEVPALTTAAGPPPTALAASDGGAHSRSAPPGQGAPQHVRGEGAQPLRVVLVGAPPFVENGAGQKPAGLSLAVLEAAAESMGVDYEVAAGQTDVASALADVARGSVDVAVGPISITAERARTVQFTQPYYQSSLAILAPAAGSLFDKVKPFLTRTFLAGCGGLLLVLVIAGAAIWFAERRQNGEQFPAHPVHGIGNGVWLALVTMTTVGYGDRVPKTVAGRAIAGVWMLLSMIIASSLTAFIATALTLSQLDGPQLSTAKDLQSKQVAVVRGTTGEQLAKRYRANTRPQSSLDEAIELVVQGRAAAVVFDRPMLRYWLARHPESHLQLSEASYVPQGYGFAVAKTATALRSRLDVAILELAAAGSIAELADQWLGQAD